MQDERIDVVFSGLRDNLPRAPEDLVERMVKTVNALETERARRKGAAKNMQPSKTAAHTMAPKQKRPPELGPKRPPGM